jgi:hypothetical protein
LSAASRLQARRQQLQQALQAVTQDVAGLDASMLHFRMYGPRPGQTFHEQFQGSTANPLTMTLHASLASTVASERQETDKVGNACIDALALQTPDPAINAALSATARSIARTCGVRRAALDAAATMEDVMRVRQRLLLRRVYNRAIERVRAEAAAVAPTPGLFGHPTHIGQLRGDLDAAIQANPIGANPRGRDARIQTKRKLQALKAVADGLHGVNIFE